MKILGIETSCDETAAAIVVGTRRGVFVQSNIISSQIEIHKKYGGVVPEVAAREHVLNILPVVDEALFLASLGPVANGARPNIDAIAVTIGPGLITSLQVGVETAKVLSYAWNIPVIGVNHIEGHIYANFVGGMSNVECRMSNLFPALILTVSGGHTMLVLMRGHGKYKVIGETLDDAAGEAFDKAAAMLGIGYPGGPAIAKRASQCKLQIQNHKSQINSKFNPEHSGQNSKFIFLPRPMINSKDYNFSFSGLKTALLYKIQKDKDWRKKIPEYCYEFQQAVIDVLIYKTIKASENFKVKTIMLSGGVAANLELRKQMKLNVECRMSNVEFLMPNLDYTTDNAAMIAVAGYFKTRRKEFTPWDKLKVDCNAEF